MKYSDFGDLVKSKFQQYVQHPSEQLGQRVVAKFPQYKQKINEEADVISQYGPGVSVGYSMSGQTGNMWGDVNKFLVDRNLPGQQITGYLSEQRQKDPQYQTNLKLSKGDKLTPEEKRNTEALGVHAIAGLSAPTQELKNNLYLARLSHDRGFKTKNGNIDMGAIQIIEDTAKKYFSNATINAIKKRYGSSQYYTALLDELEPLIYSNQ